MIECATVKQYERAGIGENSGIGEAWRFFSGESS
jgi:hypothetical protein